MRCRLSLLLSATAAITSSTIVSIAASDVTDAPYSHAGAIPPQAHQLDEAYTFEHYLSHFSKTYTDRDEYDRRSAIFSRNLQTILDHNEGKLTPDGELVDGGYVMGINQFTDVEQSELPMGYNKVLHPMWSTQLLEGGASKIQRMLGEGEGEGEDGSDTYYGTTSYSQPPSFNLDPIDQLPESVNWTQQGKVNPVIPNQGGCGSCWSFAATAVIESHYAIASGDDSFTTLSEQNMLQCTPNPDNCGGEGGCAGSTVELALNYIADITTKNTGGMFTVADVPYTSSPHSTCEAVTEGKNPTVGISGWTQMPPNNATATMNALVKAGPLAIAVAASGFGMYERGIWDGGDGTINHAVLLAGYGVDETGEKYWLVRNSWGNHFGEQGYIRIKRTDDEDTNCQMDNDPLLGVACALDDNGNKIAVEPAQICGTGGVLFDVAFPTGAHRIETPTA